MLGGLLAAVSSGDWFDVPAALSGEYFAALLLAAGAALFFFLETGADGIYEGYQRFDLMNWLNIALSLLEAVATVLVLFGGFGLVGIALVRLVRAMLGPVVKLVAVRFRLPRGSLPALKFDHDAWRSIRSFSLWNSLNDIVTEGTAHLDKLVIAALLASALVTPYSLVVTLAAAVFLVAEPITDTFFPIAATRHGLRDRAATAALMSRGTKLTISASLPVAVVILCFGDRILDLWIGEEFTDVAPAVLWFTTVNFFFSTYIWTALSILMGAGLARWVFWVSVLEVASILVMIVALVPTFGLPGLALAALLGNVAIGYVFFVRRACNISALAPARFVWSTLLRPVMACLPALAVGAWITATLRPDRWIEMFPAAALVAIGVFLSVYTVVMSPWEKRRYRATLRRALAPLRA
jgi:O-antigen/teichoic acid export membrane protein